MRKLEEGLFLGGNLRQPRLESPNPWDRSKSKQTTDPALEPGEVSLEGCREKTESNRDLSDPRTGNEVPGVIAHRTNFGPSGGAPEYP